MLFLLSPLASADINETHVLGQDGLNDTKIDNGNINETINNISTNNITKNSNLFELKTLNFDLKVNDYFEGEHALAYLNTDKDFTGNITYQVCNSTYFGHYYSTDIFKGHGVFTMPKELSAGNYTLKVTYAGDDKFSPCSAYCDFTVKKDNVKENLKLNIEVSDTPYNEPVLVEINADTSFNGVVKLDLSNGESHSVKVIHGHGGLKLNNLKVGSYSINATSVENNNFYSGGCSASFSVTKADPQLRIAVDDFKMFTRAHIDVYANENFSGNVIIEAGNYYSSSRTIYTLYVSNGHGQRDLPLFDSFNEATVIFRGNYSYEASQDTAYFTAYFTSYRDNSNMDVYFYPLLIIDKDNNLKEGQIDFYWSRYSAPGLTSFAVEIKDGNFQTLDKINGFEAAVV